MLRRGIMTANAYLGGPERPELLPGGRLSSSLRYYEYVSDVKLDLFTRSILDAMADASAACRQPR